MPLWARLEFVGGVLLAVAVVLFVYAIGLAANIDHRFDEEEKG